MIEVYAVWLNDGTAELGMRCTDCNAELLPLEPPPTALSLGALNKTATRHQQGRCR